MPIWLLLTLSGITLVGSFLFILRAMWPRHQTHDKSIKASERIWFFGDINSMTRDAHKEAMANWSEHNVKETMLAQNYILSKNVWIKHQSLNWATALTIMAIVFLFALGVAYGIAVANIQL